VTNGWPFDSDLQSWQLRSTIPTTLQGIVTLVWSGDDGDPEPGMLQLIAPFDSASQSALVGIAFAAPVDLTGKTVRAKIKVVYGLASDLGSTPAGAKIYVRSGVANVYADSGAQDLNAQGKWFDLSLNASAPTFLENGGSGYDASDIREIGIVIDTNSTAVTTTTAVVAIDTVFY
jgi:hypothetical protein